MVACRSTAALAGAQLGVGRCRRAPSVVHLHATRVGVAAGTSAVFGRANEHRPRRREAAWLLPHETVGRGARRRHASRRLCVRLPEVRDRRSHSCRCDITSARCRSHSHGSSALSSSSTAPSNSFRSTLKTQSRKGGSPAATRLPDRRSKLQSSSESGWLRHDLDYVTVEAFPRRAGELPGGAQRNLPPRLTPFTDWTDIHRLLVVLRANPSPVASRLLCGVGFGFAR